jgi:hypothetical protein
MRELRATRAIASALIKRIEAPFGCFKTIGLLPYSLR